MQARRLLFAQRADGEVNGDAAREQADGAEDRQFENLRGGWAAEAFADVEDVGDNEDDEDRRLGDDEADHADDAAVGQRPRRFGRAVDWHSSWTCESSSFVVRVRIFRVFEIPQRTAAVDGGLDGEVVGWRRRRRRTTRGSTHPMDRGRHPCLCSTSAPCCRRRPGCLRPERWRRCRR